ncbi:Hsp20/alpha crystallin family protein [Halosolutus gelatinilyticus]|uniref:Hsp20/alpha crystallin family protein n=1 Tax=Halosolutus gelatinilyticus TaxID=2931975 RepID=UPI001FF35614|nr:Hsp20/alpha crystallin family protein [Halosolutus gelatinilyticus]
MVLRPTPSTWTQGLDVPSRLFCDRDSTDYEPYEEDDEFVLTIDVPGFETDEISLAWNDGVLNVAAEHVDDERGRKKTDHRRFRFPEDVAEDEIGAQYTNGALETSLSTADPSTRSTEIPLEGE